MTTMKPAYGRSYKTAKAVRADWDAEKDFIIHDLFHPYDGKPANKQQFRKSNQIQIRFDDDRKFVIVKGGMA